MFDSWTVDQLERTLIEAEQRIGQLRAMQMALLDHLDVAQVAQLDGSRSLAEWVAARTDVDHATSRELVRTARTTADRPALRIPLARGEQSFARCAATARLATTDASAGDIWDSAGYDIAGVRRLASRRRRFTRVDEREAFERRHLVMQPSLDDAMGRIYGEFAGYDWRLIEKAINERADSFPSNRACERTTAPQRRADALTAICQDTLDNAPAGGTTSQVPLLTVFVDARTRTDDLQNVDAVVEAGPESGSPPSSASCAAPPSRRSASRATGHHWHSVAPPAPSPPSCAASSSTATTAAPPTPAPPATASSPITSAPGAKAVAPIPTTSPRSAGTTTTSSSTARATASTPKRRPAADASSDRTPNGRHPEHPRSDTRIAPSRLASGFAAQCGDPV